MTSEREGKGPSRPGPELPQSTTELVEHVPLPIYVFRTEESDFVLEGVSAEARRQNPGIVTLLGRPMKGIYKHQPQAIEDAERCVREGVEVVREMSVRRYDRTEATQQVRLTFVPLPPRHMIICMEDVATPAVAQLALVESEARYRSVVTSLPDAVILRGADGAVLACNDLAVRMLGAKAEG